MTLVAPSPEEIREVERAVGARLPRSYVRHLHVFGNGRFLGRNRIKPVRRLRIKEIEEGVVKRTGAETRTERYLVFGSEEPGCLYAWRVADLERENEPEVWVSGDLGDQARLLANPARLERFHPSIEGLHVGLIRTKCTFSEILDRWAREDTWSLTPFYLGSEANTWPTVRANGSADA